ncbi:MAG: hypothetical protein WAM17_19025 [Rhodoplanes sp.]
MSSAPLSLSDDDLAEIMRRARPLEPSDRHSVGVDKRNRLRSAPKYSRTNGSGR